jgi:uncharacterized protein (DUF736 family)
MEYDNNNRGSLFKNDRKDDAKFPDYKGSINVDGTDYWLSAWIKISKDGNKFMSLSVKNKNADAPKKPVKTDEHKDWLDDYDKAPF